MLDGNKGALVMAVQMSMNAVVSAMVLAFGLTSPMAAHAVCFDDPCPPAAAHNQAGGTSLEFNIKSNYRYKVGIKFYSQTRNHVWPDSDNFWVLDDYATHTYRLSCMRGEEICYGAWATGNDKTYWGVGHGGQKSCRDCCYTCGDTASRTLTD
jgi:hypothetical protein